MHHEEDLQRRIRNSWCKQTLINSITAFQDIVFLSCPFKALYTRSHYCHPNFPEAQELPQAQSPPSPSFGACLGLGVWDGWLCFLSPWARCHTKDKMNRQAPSLLPTCTCNIQWEINAKERKWPGVTSHAASLQFSKTGPFWTHLRTLQLQSQWPHLSPLKCFPPVDLVDDVHLCLTRHPTLKKEEKITDSDVNSE